MTETETAAPAAEPKAYDLKELLAGLKARGIDVAEDAARGLVEEVFAWTKASAKVSPNQMDDMLVGLLTPVETYVYAKIDEIDGKKG